MKRVSLREQIWLTLWAAAVIVIVGLATGIQPANGSREAIVAHDDWAREMVSKQVATQRDQRGLRAEVRSLRLEIRSLLQVIRDDPRRP